ncbi:FabD/lysophospholipase-like protein, partial [Gloeophyllum trabeum ATCC 11539]
MPMALRHPSHRRILSLDGGGLRGLSSLLVVERIMEETGKIAGRNTPVRPCEVFDMICGSSTGGLIALLLGRLGLECSVAIEAYKNIVGRLMGEEPQPFWDRLLSGSGDHGSDKERQYEEQVKALVGTYGGTSLFQMPSPGGQHCK